MAEAANKRKTAAQKAAEEEVKQVEQQTTETTEATEQQTTEQQAPEAIESEGISLCEALANMERGEKYRRAGWPKELKGHYVTVRRGETIPVFGDDRYTSPYTPSLEDVMSADWEKIEEGEDNA